MQDDGVPMQDDGVPMQEQTDASLVEDCPVRAVLKIETELKCSVTLKHTYIYLMHNLV